MEEPLQKCHGGFIASSRQQAQMPAIRLHSVNKSTNTNYFMKPESILCSGMKMAGLAALFTVGAITAQQCVAGQAKKWEEVPEAVRATILGNGGKVGSVDKESGKIGGKVVYEAVGKDKDGKEVDLVVNEDGKLVMTKDDDAADRAKEQAASAKKMLTRLKFSHPRDITNPYLPLASLKQDILEGKEGSKTTRIERTAKPELRKTFKIGKQTVEALAVEDREFENGELSEVAMDYFAQADDGTVLYLGEDVDEYKNGNVAGHSGAWMFGKDTKRPGVLMPGNPKVGDKFKSEDVSKDIHEEDEVLSLSETVTVPAGTYQNCLKIKEKLADGEIEYKYFARGIGCVREVPAEGDVLLKSHTTLRAAK